MSGVDYAIAHYPIDRARVATMGHSYGGFMTNWLITQYPERFAAAASGAGISNWFSDYGIADIYRTKEMEFFGAPWQEEGIKRMITQSPLMQAGHVRTPTLFINGEMDQRVPYEEGEQMYFALRRQGVPAKMIQYSDRLADRLLDAIDLIEMQEIVAGVEAHHISGALFAALGVDTDALQVFWRRALDQFEIVATQHAERLQRIGGIGFGVMQPIGPEVLVVAGDRRSILREGQPHAPSPHHF